MYVSVCQICKEQNQLQDISKKFSIYSESVLVSAKCKINIYVHTYYIYTYGQDQFTLH